MRLSSSSPPPVTGPDRRVRPRTVEDAASSDGPGLVWGLSRGDRWFLAVMLAVFGTLLALHVRRDAVRQSAPVQIVRANPAVRAADSSRPREAPRQTAAEPYRFQLDPNTATWVEWTQLDGIGPTLAKRIVEDRAAHGPYRTLEDLRRVKGIGVKTLDKLQPHLTFEAARE